MTYAVLQTDPLMTTTQWLLLTLTAGGRVAPRRWSAGWV